MARGGPVNAFARQWTRLRGTEPVPGLRTLKVAAATVVAYVVAGPLPGSDPPVVAALTAMLVVQLTPYQTLKTGWQRIGGVTAGVLIAVLLAAVVGLTWWSLGLTVLGALVVGHVLRLEGNAVEVPISAMLVLAVGSAVGLLRVYETLVGAAVGVVASLLTPRVYVQPAGDAIGALAGRIAALLRSVAGDLARSWSPDWAIGALRRARDLERDVAQARTALTRAEDSVRLNPRGRSSAHVPPALRSGLTALEYSVINVRVICRSLADRVVGVPPPQLPDARLRRPLARLLDAAADAVAAFGDVVARDVAGPARGEDEARLRTALERARFRRAAAATALAVNPRNEPDVWRVHGALLAHVDRLLAEIDPDAEAAGDAVRRHRPAQTRLAQTRAARTRAARSARTANARLRRMSASALRRVVRRTGL